MINKLKSVTYGFGGYDESKPDNNVVEILYYTDEEVAAMEAQEAAEAEALAAEEAAKQQAFNDAVAQAVAAILAAQTPATTAEPTVTE